MNDILNRLHVQCGSDLHDGFVRSLFSEAAVEIERLRRDAERYRWLKSNGRSDSDILWDYQGEELDRVIDSEIAREGANV